VKPIKLTNKSVNSSPVRPENVDFGGYEIMADIIHSKDHQGKGYGWKISDNEITIEPNGLAFVGTGLYCDIAQGYEIEIRQICWRMTKSGILAISDVVQANHKGEILVILHNISNKRQKIRQGDIIAEIVLREASRLEL